MVGAYGTSIVTVKRWRLYFTIKSMTQSSLFARHLGVATRSEQFHWSKKPIVCFCCTICFLLMQVGRVQDRLCYRNYTTTILSRLPLELVSLVFSILFALMYDSKPFNCRSCRRIRRRQDWGSGIPVFGSETNNLPIFDSFNNLAVISMFQDGQ